MFNLLQSTLNSTVIYCACLGKTYAFVIKGQQMYSLVPANEGSASLQNVRNQ